MSKDYKSLRGINISELQETCIYRCLISNRNVYIQSVRKIDNNNFEVKGYAYNAVSGSTECIYPADGQLRTLGKQEYLRENQL